MSGGGGGVVRVVLVRELLVLNQQNQVRQTTVYWKEDVSLINLKYVHKSPTPGVESDKSAPKVSSVLLTKTNVVIGMNTWISSCSPHAAVPCNSFSVLVARRRRLHKVGTVDTGCRI